MTAAYQAYADFSESDDALTRAQNAYMRNAHRDAFADFKRALESHPRRGEHAYAGEKIAQEVLLNGVHLFGQSLRGKCDLFLATDYLLLAAKYIPQDEHKISAVECALTALDKAAERNPRVLNDNARIATYASRIFRILPSSTVEGLMKKSEALKHWTREMAELHTDDDAIHGTNSAIVAMQIRTEEALDGKDGFSGIANAAISANVTTRAQRIQQRSNQPAPYLN